MRNQTLHRLLQEFTLDAAARLSLAAGEGAEIPFEVVEADAGPRRHRAPLYCYRPLTTEFIRQRLGLLVALSTYAPVARALEAAEGTEAYLRARGERRVSERPRDRADAALRCFLDRVFAERSEFGFDDARFADSYDELERSLYQGHCVVEIVAPMLGVGLDQPLRELPLGDGLSLIRRDALAGAPDDVTPPSAETADGEVLVLLRMTQDRVQPAPVSVARARFRRVLTALRLFERGGYALGPIGSSRVDDGPWTPIPLGSSGRPRLVTNIGVAQEDEFRAFCSLVARRLPAPGRGAADSSGFGEVTWALARFEMGCERIAPFEALTDYLLALRALLEPEGPSSGRLAQRLAVICARPEERTSLAERTAHAISLERAVIAGLAPADNPSRPVDALVDELAEHLRAILRDVLCGHLDADVRGVADELLAEAAAAPA